MKKSNFRTKTHLPKTTIFEKIIIIIIIIIIIQKLKKIKV